MQTISVRDLEEHINRYHKERTWLNKLSSRYGLIPTPQPCAQSSVIVQELKERHQGRMFVYPEETKAVVDEIVRLHEKEHLSYADIAKQLVPRVQAINKKWKTELSRDPRLKSEGFLINFQAAGWICRQHLPAHRRDRLTTTLRAIEQGRKQEAQAYYRLLKQIKAAQGAGAPTTALQAQREIVGQRLDLYYQLMENVIGYAVDVVKKRHAQQDWAMALREVTRKDGG